MSNNPEPPAPPESQGPPGQPPQPNPGWETSAVSLPAKNETGSRIAVACAVLLAAFVAFGVLMAVMAMAQYG